MRHMPSFNPFLGIISGLLCLAVALAVAVGITFLVMALVKKRRKAFFGEGETGPGGWRPGGPWGHGPGHRHHGHGPRPPFEALRILDERLARSEIDVDDYLTRRTVLLGDRPNGTEYDPGDFGEHHEPPRPPHPGPPQPPPTPEAPTPPRPDPDGSTPDGQQSPGRRLDSEE